MNIKLKCILAIISFGMVGIFVHFIPLSSECVVLYRAVLANIYFIIVSFVTKRKCDVDNIKKNIIWLCITGVCMALNWVCQFEAYKIASVSVGTVCYNTMPIFVIILSTIFFKEKISLKNILCIFLAMIGIVLVSDILKNGFIYEEFKGCALGIIGALFYALVVIINKKMKDINTYDKLIVQFLVVILIMVPYIMCDKNNSFLFASNIIKEKYFMGIICLLIVGFGITGVAYTFYYDSIIAIEAKDIAIYTYLDPVVALILSFVILRERLNLLQIIGAILILLATIINEKNKN